MKPFRFDNIESVIFPAEMCYLVHFELSPKGQQLVKRYGFYPLTSNYQEQNKRNGFE